jgi:hypothetical protein
MLRIASSGMLRHVVLVRTDVSEELSVSIIRVTRIGELGVDTANVIPSSKILVTLITEALSFSGTSVLTTPTRRKIPEDGILLIEMLLTCGSFGSIIRGGGTHLQKKLISCKYWANCAPSIITN